MPPSVEELERRLRGRNDTPEDQIAIRMERAKQLILEGRHSIKEIADLLGISNPFYFSTAFRRYVGMSPSQYRKELRG